MSSSESPASSSARADGVDRAEPHAPRIEARRTPTTRTRPSGGTGQSRAAASSADQQGHRAVGDRAGVAHRHRAVAAVEDAACSRASCSSVWSWRGPGVVAQRLARGRREDRHDLLAQPPGAPRPRAGGSSSANSSCRARASPNSRASTLGGLAHGRARDTGSRSASSRARARPQQRRPEAQRGAEPRERRPRARQPLEPRQPYAAGNSSGSPAHGLGAAGQHQPRSAPSGCARRPRHRLHARAAVAVHGDRGHALRDAGAQGGHARDVGGVGRLGAVAQHHLVEARRVELVARQQLVHRQRGRARPRPGGGAPSPPSRTGCATPPRIQTAAAVMVRPGSALPELRQQLAGLRLVAGRRAGPAPAAGRPRAPARGAPRRCASAA